MKKLAVTYLLFCLIGFTAQAQKAKMPTIMVVPDDDWCFTRGYYSEYYKDNKKKLCPDYEKAFLHDTEIKSVVTQIGKMFSQVGTHLIDLEQELKNIEDDQEKLQNFGKNKSVELNPADRLIEKAKADILLKVTWQVNRSGPYRSVSFTIKAVDAYTAEQIGGETGTGENSSEGELSILLKEAVLSHVENLQEQMQDHFDDLLKNGRKISMRLISSAANPVDLQETALYNFVRTWLETNAVGGIFNESDATETQLVYKQVRIPMFQSINGKDRPMDATRFGLNIKDQIQKSFACSVSIRPWGLGDVWLMLEKKTTSSTKSQDVVIQQEPTSISDVDVDIPKADKQKTNTYCLIVGNEDYTKFQAGLSSEVNVTFARSDAQSFAAYAEIALGIPKENITVMTDAIGSQMKKEVTRFVNKARFGGEQTELIFYYAGHGYPDKVTGDSYIMPVDISATNVRDGIKLSQLYDSLSIYPTKRITIFLDACFSGGGRNQGLLAARSVKVKPKQNVVAGNVVVFASSSGEQESLPYNDKKHGLFTYFLLKKIQETKGNVNYSDLYSYLKNKVAFVASDKNAKDQIPELNVSPSAYDSWKSWMLK